MNKKVISSLTIVVALVIGFFVYQNITAVKVQEVNVSAQQSKINEYAHPESFITPEELKAMQEDENQDVVAIGVLKSKDEAIPGSFVLWRPDYQESKEVPYGGVAAPKEDMEKLLSDFGVKEDTTIVTYAANDQHDATRLLWQLKVLGHEDVRLLDGGLNVWIGAGYETAAAAEVGDRPKTDYVATNFNEEALNADLEEVVEAVENTEDYYLLDTRSESEETGSDTKQGAFGPGKIEGSDWIEYSQATAEDGTLKSKAELEELYADVLKSDKEIICYCQSGVRSAYTWFVLTQAIGYDKVQNYDGSWIEWSYNAYEKQDPAVAEHTENGKF
ncbi:sulfurtransferase [Bacillus sp. Marseille-P3661]|uniref:sulfurtransferase n=1 Tax=Bacillus sp. Marseille-P3661 TaxID=1936234 RepID=UPI000C818696|nr:rhodanese-like domain-containing protein [Bacillus sp. Marseille-P3661]